MTSTPPPLVFGIRDPLPFAPSPDPRRAKPEAVRMRHGEFATAFVLTDEGLTEHYIVEKDGRWELAAPLS